MTTDSKEPYDENALVEKLKPLVSEHPATAGLRQEWSVEQMSEQLHIWYLEGTRELDPENYNPKAQKAYADLNDQQKQIDRYIAGKVLAALTAERQRREQAEHRTQEIAETYKVEMERYRRESGCPADQTLAVRILQLRATEQQLLSELAAIEKVKPLLADCTEVMAYQALLVLQAVDLSPLHEHDSKVRKAYIERLTTILKDRSKGEVDTWGFVAMFLDMMKEADDALAKVKEGGK